MPYDVGDVWDPQLTVKDSAGVLTAATVSLSVTSPSGTVTTPTTATASTGVYTATVPLTESGRWLAVWTVSGALTGVETQSAYVRRLGANAIPLDFAKARLNKTATVDDDELAEMLDAAIAEYEEWVGPVSGTVTETFDGGGSTLVLRQPVSAITAAAYDSAATLTYTDLNVSNGIVRWGYGTVGMFTPGSRVSITYTVPSLPANHREVIIADVAGYFAVTQRGTDSPAGFPGDDEYAAAYTPTPQVLFPRIRELAKQYPSVA